MREITVQLMTIATAGLMTLGTLIWATPGLSLAETGLGFILYLGGLFGLAVLSSSFIDLIRWRSLLGPQKRRARRRRKEEDKIDN
jgi:hypothetical protein